MIDAGPTHVTIPVNIGNQAIMYRNYHGDEAHSSGQWDLGVHVQSEVSMRKRRAKEQKHGTGPDKIGVEG
jgi:hypothetical protein